MVINSKPLKLFQNLCPYATMQCDIPEMNKGLSVLSWWEFVSSSNDCFAAVIPKEVIFSNCISDDVIY